MNKRIIGVTVGTTMNPQKIASPNEKANAIKTAYSGETIVATDSAEAKFEGLRVLGRSEQASTTGAQLLNYEESLYATDDGVLGKPNYSNLSTIVDVMEADSIYLSGDFSLLNSEYAILGLCEEYPAIGVKSTRKKIFSNTAIDTTDSNYAVIYLPTIDKKEAIKKSFMINYGNEALPFEPYTGGKPSPNPDYPQPIESVGKDGSVDVGVYTDNLLPYPYRGSSTTSNGGTMNIQEDGGIACSGTPTGYIGIELYKKDIPCNKFRVCLLGNAKNVILEAHMIDANNNYLSGTSIALGKSILFDVKDYPTATKIYVGIKRNDSNIEMSGVAYPMIVAGDVVPKEYKPYIKQSLSISTPNGLPGIKVTDASLATYTDAEGNMWCADEIDFSRGKYVQRIGTKIFDGSDDESWSYSSYKQPSIDTLVVYGVDYVENFVSNDANPSMSNITTWNLTRGILNTHHMRGNNSIAFTIAKEKFPTLDDFKNYVVENPIIVHSILATPIETDLTAEQLEAYRALTSNYPTTTILNDENAHMETTMVADTKNYIDNKFAALAAQML